jgi:hypothetical protein
MSAPCFVYFVQAGDGGNIKIGISTDVLKRITKMQSDCPEKLNLLLVVPGDGAREAHLHDRLSAHRRDGEWFTPCNEIFKLIDELSGEAVDVSKPKRTRAPRGEHDPIITAFGGPAGMIKALAGALGADIDREAVYKWAVNGIPWKFRPAIHRLAQAQGIATPSNFLGVGA